MSMFFWLRHIILITMNQALAIVPSLSPQTMITSHADRVESTWKQKSATTVLVVVRRGPKVVGNQSSQTVIRMGAASTITFDDNDNENDDVDNDDEDGVDGDMIY